MIFSESDKACECGGAIGVAPTWTRFSLFALP